MSDFNSIEIYCQPLEYGSNPFPDFMPDAEKHGQWLLSGFWTSAKTKKEYLICQLWNQQPTQEQCLDFHENVVREVHRKKQEKEND